jgi:hypothetical protein
MQRRFINENVDLSVLADHTIRFLEKEEFDDVVEVKTETGYQIIAGNSPIRRISKDILISIDGTPEEFFINLELSEERKMEHLSIPVMLATMIGGGYFVLKHLRSDEAWLKFKMDFWKQMNALIANLRFSARPPTEQKPRKN